MQSLNIGLACKEDESHHKDSIFAHLIFGTAKNQGDIKRDVLTLLLPVLFVN